MGIVGWGRKEPKRTTPRVHPRKPKETKLETVTPKVEKFREEAKKEWKTVKDTKDLK